MVAVPDYIEHVTREVLTSESFNACGDPYGTSYGHDTWKGERFDGKQPGSSYIDFLGADAVHDNLGIIDSTNAAKNGKCNDKNNVLNRAALKFEDFMIMALNPPGNGLVQKTIRHIIHMDTVSPPHENYQFFKKSRKGTKSPYISDKCPAAAGSTAYMPYIEITAAGKTAKMGSEMLSHYMTEKYTYPQQLGKLHFQVITDCNPALAQKAASISNDLDTGLTCSERGFCYVLNGAPGAATPPPNIYDQKDDADPNIYTIISSDDGENTIKKHRPLGQHMMIRILSTYKCWDQIFENIVSPLELDPRAHMTNSDVVDVVQAVEAHITTNSNFAAAAGDTVSEKDFLLQDLYTNWIWQITLIHMFNVKFNVDNSNISNTTIETVFDKKVKQGRDNTAKDAQKREKRAHINAFYRLSNCIFKMNQQGTGVDIKICLRDGGGVLKHETGLSIYYQRVVDKFYKDFWSHVPGVAVNPAVNPADGWKAVESSKEWLARGHSLGWSGFTPNSLSQGGVATFLRTAYLSGARDHGVAKHQHSFTEFVNNKLTNVSISNLDDDHTPWGENLKETVGCGRTDKGSKRKEDCHCNNAAKKQNGALIVNYCTHTDSAVHKSSQPHPYGFENFLPDTDAPKIPKQFYPHQGQFAAALTEADSDAKKQAIYLEQLSQIFTSIALKTIGDQSHLGDFMEKSKHLDNNSIRPILQICDRPLDALSMKYLSTQTSFGMIICAGNKVFVNEYANHAGWKGISPANPKKNLLATKDANDNSIITDYTTGSPPSINFDEGKHFCICWIDDADVVQAKVPSPPDKIKNWNSVAVATLGAGAIVGGLAYCSYYGGDDGGVAAFVSGQCIKQCQVAANFIGTTILGIQGGGGWNQEHYKSFMEIKKDYYNKYIQYWNSSDENKENCIDKLNELQIISTRYMQFLDMWNQVESPLQQYNFLRGFRKSIWSMMVLYIKNNSNASESTFDSLAWVWPLTSNFINSRELSDDERHDVDNEPESQHKFGHEADEVEAAKIEHVQSKRKVAVEDVINDTVNLVKDVLPSSGKHQDDLNDILSFFLYKAGVGQQPSAWQCGGDIRGYWMDSDCWKIATNPGEGTYGPKLDLWDKWSIEPGIDMLLQAKNQADKVIFKQVAALQEEATHWEIESAYPRGRVIRLVGRRAPSGRVRPIDVHNFFRKAGHHGFVNIMLKGSVNFVDEVVTFAKNYNKRSIQSPVLRVGDAAAVTPRKMSVKDNWSVLDSKMKRIDNMYDKNKSDRDNKVNSSRGFYGGKLIRNKRSKKYKKTKRGKKSRRGKKSQKKKKVKCVKKSRKCVKKSRKRRNTRRKRHHSKKL